MLLVLLYFFDFHVVVLAFALLTFELITRLQKARKSAIALPGTTHASFLSSQVVKTFPYHKPNSKALSSLSLLLLLLLLFLCNSYVAASSLAQEALMGNALTDSGGQVGGEGETLRLCWRWR